MGKEKLKTALKEHFTNSTIHGLSKIQKSNSILIKSMWILFFLLAIGMCSFMIFQNISNYLKFETKTKIETKFELTPVFPSVTICNVNFFTSDFAVEYFSNRSSISSDPLAKKHITINQIYSEYSSNTEKFGDSLEKLIILCSFSLKNCNESNWKFYHDNLFGNCFQFNNDHQKLINNTIPGYLNGLRIILNVSVPNELRHLNHQYGAIVFVHNHTELPDQGNFITAPAGFESFISVSRVFINKLKKPYSDCDGNTDNPNAYDSHIFKFIHSKGLKYTQNFCFSICVQKLIIDKCNCLSPLFPLIEKNYSLCSVLNRIDCGKSIINEFSYNFKVSSFCSELCPLECETMKLEKSYSMVNIINDEWEEMIQNPFNVSEIEKKKVKNEALRINIFYQDNSYTSISETESFDIITLISNIGGIAGLFLGASFLSFLELFELTINFLILITKNRQKVNKIKQNINE